MLRSAAVIASLLILSSAALAQQPSRPPTTFEECRSVMTNGAQEGEMQRRAGANEVMNAEPKFTEMSCLGDVLSGAGLDIFGGIDIAGMLSRVKNQVCAAGQSALRMAKSQGTGCGIYASGWNMGVPGYGMGQLCQSVYLGGGGGEIFGAGTRAPSTGFGNIFGRAPDAAPATR